MCEALLGLGAFGAVFASTLSSGTHSRSIERASDHVVAHTWKILNLTATNEDDRVFLKVVTLATDVGGDFDTIC